MKKNEDGALLGDLPLTQAEAILLMTLLKDDYVTSHRLGQKTRAFSGQRVVSKLNTVMLELEDRING